MLFALILFFIRDRPLNDLQQAGVLRHHYEPREQARLTPDRCGRLGARPAGNRTVGPRLAEGSGAGHLSDAIPALQKESR